jgi:type II secretory pathway component PulF
VDEIVWALPVVGSTARDRGLADVLAAIADGLEAGWPFDAVLREASTLDVNRVLQARVREWAGASASGATPAEAARAGALPALVTGMFQTAKGPEDAVLVARFLSAHYAAKYDRVAIAIRAIWPVVMVLLFGLFVGFVALALFQPLQRLVDSVHVYPVTM